MFRVALMKPELLQEVIVFVPEATGFDLARLTADTRLNGELGVDGDDGNELLAAYASRFRVDMEGFRFDDYFGPEAAWNFSIVELQPLRIGRLAEAAERGP